MPDSQAKLPLPPEAIAALQQGNTINAIKIIREIHGLSLLEAKQLAESVQLELAAVPPRPILGQNRFFPTFLTPLAFSFGGLALLYQANGFLLAKSTGSYCETAYRGRYLICQLSVELGEQYFGVGKGYVGSALFLLLLGGLLGLLAWLSYRAIQANRDT